MTQAARFPRLARGLGIGLDLPWGAPVGFGADIDAGGRAREGATPALRAFVDTYAAAPAPAIDHLFFSFQPRDRGRLRLDDYAPAWDDLCSRLPPGLPRALHHTALNLAALEPPGRGRAQLVDFTNALCQRYGLRWINEDVGFWSLSGRPLPYPLPPLLDAGGLAACTRNVRAYQRDLVAPLVLEFPGFSAGVSLVLGDMDAYDFFRRLAEETGAPVTLDVAHLLSWRWWRGFRGAALYDDLQRLPLEACFEIHLSGCEIAGDRFIDAHHGRLLDQQFGMLERLLPACPNLRAVTFEDPRLDAGGALDAASAASLARLRGAVSGWLAAGPAPDPPAPPERRPAAEVTLDAPRAATPDVASERALAALLFDRDARARWRADADREGRRQAPFSTLDGAALEEAGRAVVAMVRGRRHRGTGRLADAFPLCVAAWTRLHPEDADLDELHAHFLASPETAAWREQATGDPGTCIEQCFAAFARAQGVADPATIEEELLSALLRTLAVTPEPAFVVPGAVRRGKTGWFAVSAETRPPVLHAASGGRYMRGEITPLIALLLDGASVQDAAAISGCSAPAVAAVSQRLADLGLCPS